jgi:hypothetical protein
MPTPMKKQDMTTPVSVLTKLLVSCASTCFVRKGSAVASPSRAAATDTLSATTRSCLRLQILLATR